MRVYTTQMTLTRAVWLCCLMAVLAACKEKVEIIDEGNPPRRIAGHALYFQADLLQYGWFCFTDRRDDDAMFVRGAQTGLRI